MNKLPFVTKEKVEEIAAKLRTAKNPNVITYKTENNEISFYKIKFTSSAINYNQFYILLLR